MKQTMIVFLPVALLLLATTVMAAGIQGNCTDCHTMHNSEQGQAVAVFGVGADPATANHSAPVQNLLRMDCIACHARNTEEKIVTLPGGSSIPQVYHQDSSDLAAGNFRHIDVGGNRKGHNVVDIVAAESNLSFPPGFRHATAEINNGGFAVNRFTCAGSMGCHGYRGQVMTDLTEAPAPCNSEFEVCPGDTGDQLIYRTGLSALSGFEGTSFKRGAHHSNVEGLKGGAGSPEFEENPLAGSYRFLYAMRGLGNGVDRWQNIDKNSHNEYYGVAGGTTNFSTAGCGSCHLDNTINTITSRIYTPNRSVTGFCITCHGDFHSSGLAGPGNGSSGAFLRHPSDYLLPDRGEYSAYRAYDVTAPVARPDLAAIGDSTAVRPGTDLVMCLSCHVAHASPYDGMLRFDYAAMTAGSFTDVPTAQAQGGCLACHTTKGVVPENR